MQCCQPPSSKDKLQKAFYCIAILWQLGSESKELYCSKKNKCNLVPQQEHSEVKISNINDPLLSIIQSMSSS